MDVEEIVLIAGERKSGLDTISPSPIAEKRSKV
jgi:hypothetical protein